jgi:hypothetical protein
MDSVVRRQAEPAPGWTVPELEENRNTAAHLRPAHRVLHDVRDRGRALHGRTTGPSPTRWRSTCITRARVTSPSAMGAVVGQLSRTLVVEFRAERRFQQCRADLLPGDDGVQGTGSVSTHLGHGEDTEVRGTGSHRASGMSLYPPTAKFFPTTRPCSRAAPIAPIAAKSLIAKIAVISGWRSSRACAAS